VGVRTEMEEPSAVGPGPFAGNHWGTGPRFQGGRDGGTKVPKPGGARGGGGGGGGGGGPHHSVMDSCPPGAKKKKTPRFVEKKTDLHFPKKGLVTVEMA